MAFAIMRMAKIKDKRGVTMALQHNTRERFPQNADPNLTPKNQTYGGTTAESLNRFDGILPEKIRKNAVLAVELVMTASPDFGTSPAHGNMTDYLTACDDWALKTFGIDLNKKDIRPAIHVAHHFDEKTPHTHILIVPMKDGKLNAKHFIGGTRNRMAELQEDFYQTVGKRFGLDRGKPAAETRARHSRQKFNDLEEREKKVDEKLEQVKTASAEIREIHKMSPEFIMALKKEVEGYNKQTPNELRQLATVMDGKNCKNILEYRTKIKAEKQQGIKSSRGFS